MKYGYYLAATDERLGDSKLADQAWYEWTFRVGRTKPFARFEGASIWIDENSIEHCRIIVRDIFANLTVQYDRCLPFEIPKYCYWPL